MRLFDFFKRKLKPEKSFLEKVNDTKKLKFANTEEKVRFNNTFYRPLGFPNGANDLDAGMAEVLFILNNKVNKEIAMDIFHHSHMASRIFKPFNKVDLQKALILSNHIQYFDDKQTDNFHKYIVALNRAFLNANKGPSEVKRNGDDYF